VLLALEDKARLAGYPATVHFYLGEAYRMRGGKDDGELAEAEYHKAVNLAPSFAPSYRALGLAHMKKKKNREALRNFRRYLQLAPDARDRPYISGYISQLEREGE